MPVFPKKQYSILGSLLLYVPNPDKPELNNDFEVRFFVDGRNIYFNKFNVSTKISEDLLTCST